MGRKLANAFEVFDVGSNVIHQCFSIAALYDQSGGAALDRALTTDNNVENRNLNTSRRLCIYNEGGYSHCTSFKPAQQPQTR